MEVTRFLLSNNIFGIIHAFLDYHMYCNNYIDFLVATMLFFQNMKINRIFFNYNNDNTSCFIYKSITVQRKHIREYPSVQKMFYSK